jgi:1-acyl-sn-glycerol-3-phosphate acyltransferase
VFYWLCKHILIGPWLRLLFRPSVEGLEHLPADGAAILASNHLSFSDSIFLPLVVDRHITFLAKSDYFNTPGLKGWATKLFMSGAGQVPVDRSGGRASEAAINTGVRILNAGELLGIYPEGTRSPDGRLYRGKTGVARMALEAKVPVIPVAMIDTDKIQPPGQVWPKIMRVRIAIGEPLDFSRYEGMEGDRFILRSMTDEIMYELMQLSGQEYVDMYATKAKSLIAEAAAAPAQVPAANPPVSAPAA